MQYLLMCCFNEDDWEAIPEEERDRIMDAYGAWIEDVDKSGKHVTTAKLAPSTAATTVRVQNGESMISDGPFAETREQLGGYHLVDCANLDEAIALARRIPTLPAGGTIEVRPLDSAS